MAQSRRTGRAKAGKVERLDATSLAVNALLALVAAPVLFAVGLMLILGIGFQPTPNNQNMFLGSVAGLIAVFFLLLSGLKLWEHVRARRRFRELLHGEQKSAVMRNLDELTSLARAMGPGYRRQLDERLDELGIKR
jgi:hypothetical protein